MQIECRGNSEGMLREWRRKGKEWDGRGQGMARARQGIYKGAVREWQENGRKVEGKGDKVMLKYYLI